MKQVSYDLLFAFIGFLVGLGAWWVIFHGLGLFGGLLGAFIGAAIGNGFKKRSLATKDTAARALQEALAGTPHGA